MHIALREWDGDAFCIERFLHLFLHVPVVRPEIVSGYPGAEHDVDGVVTKPAHADSRRRIHQRAIVFFEQALADSTPGEPLRLRIAGLNDVGEPVEFTSLLEVPEGADGAERMQALGIETVQNGDQVVIDNVAFDSPAQAAGLDWDQTILLVRAPAPAPSKYWIYIPAALILALVVWLQRRRAGPGEGQARREEKGLSHA